MPVSIYVGFCVQSDNTEEKMALITTICAVGTAIGAVFFSLWMVKQLFAKQ